MANETILRICWMALAAVHATPALVLLRPSLIERLYGTSADGTAGLLLLHRGAAFFALITIAVWAAFDPAVRRLATVAIAISVVGFLAIYVRGGLPTQLRTIAIVDLLALLPLSVVAWAAWVARD